MQRFSLGKRFSLTTSSGSSIEAPSAPESHALPDDLGAETSQVANDFVEYPEYAEGRIPIPRSESSTHAQLLDAANGTLISISADLSCMSGMSSSSSHTMNTAMSSPLGTPHTVQSPFMHSKVYHSPVMLEGDDGQCASPYSSMPTAVLDHRILAESMRERKSRFSVAPLTFTRNVANQLSEHFSAKATKGAFSPAIPPVAVLSDQGNWTAPTPRRSASTIFTSLFGAKETPALSPDKSALVPNKATTQAMTPSDLFAGRSGTNTTSEKVSSPKPSAVSALRRVISCEDTSSHRSATTCINSFTPSKGTLVTSPSELSVRHSPIITRSASMPQGLLDEIHRFAFVQYAERHFAISQKKRSAPIFKKSQSLEQRMRWQSVS